MRQRSPTLIFPSSLSLCPFKNHTLARSPSAATTRAGSAERELALFDGSPNSLRTARVMLVYTRAQRECVCTTSTGVNQRQRCNRLGVYSLEPFFFSFFFRFTPSTRHFSFFYARVRSHIPGTSERATNSSPKAFFSNAFFTVFNFFKPPRL